MTMFGYGPLERIDGPPPLPPVYGLLQAAAAPAAGVRIVVDAEATGPDLGDSAFGLEGITIPQAGRERWLNGVQVYPYPPDLGDTFDACATGSPAEEKAEGGVVPLPRFEAITAYLPETCSALGIGDQEAFRARAVLALGAVEGSIVAREFLTGARMLNNPHLSDGEGTFPNGDSATSVSNGLALLEAEIAKSGKQGLIHCTPMAATAARERFAIDDRGGVLRTINGVVVIPDFGYVNGATPDGGGHPDPAVGQEWMYATGPIDIRRSEVSTTPDRVEEALDRSANSITYRAERYYLIDWDTVVQAAVLVDRCFTTCTS